MQNQNQETLPQGPHSEQAPIDWRLVVQITLPVAYLAGGGWLVIQTHDYLQNLSLLQTLAHASWALLPYLYFTVFGVITPHPRQQVACALGASLLVLAY